MNDLVRPTALFGGARVPAVGPSGVLGSVPNPPPQAAQLPIGSTLTGVVVGHDATGHTLVRTDLGTLSVATKTQLPVNSEVTLQIRSSGGQLHVLIMHSELPHGGAKGVPAPQHPLPAGAPAGGAGPQGQTATATGGGQPGPLGHGPASDLLTLGQTLRAVVQSPANAANAASGGSPGGAQPPAAAQALSALAAQLAPGSELQLRITSVQAPAAQTAGTQAAAGPVSGGPASGAPRPGPLGPTTPGSAAPSAATPGITAPGATAAGVPGGTPNIAGRIAAYGALQGGAGQAAPPNAAGATPNRPSPAAATPPAAAPGVASGQGTAAGPGNAPSAAAATPASGVPASGALASYVAASGASGAGAQGPGAAATASGLVAAQGMGQGGGQGSGPVATSHAARPGTAPGANTANAAGPIQFAGSVTAITHAGRPVVQTPLGTLTLEIRAPLQAGSRLTFELPGGALPSGYPGAATPGPAALGTLAHSWPALEEALRALQEVAPPGVAAATLQEVIPQPGSRLASGLLFFLSALGAGDVTRWIGNQASQALRGAGRDSLLSRLGQDFGQLGRLADNQGGDWRLFFMPLYDGDQLRQLRLFLRHGRHEQDGGGAQDDEDQTRFVVEVEMTRLGDLQLDGLVRDRRLDLILRSRAPLPEFMRRDIMQIFHDANQITGYQGNLGFQSSLEWKAMPIEAPEAAEAAGVVV